MQQQTIAFSSGKTTFCFDTTFEELKEVAPAVNSFIITDENLMLHYQQEFKPWKVITVPAGETSKTLDILDDIIRQLIALDAGRDATIIGIGGGVVTDIAGFVAGIYKRGVRCILVPTSVLGMVDAAIGGKNGLDIGEYKNMMGLIRQPAYILYDYRFLKTLPPAEWTNGFAEIIKHACIGDAAMFALLEQHTLKDFHKDETLLKGLIRGNALQKATVVQEDEQEQGIRKYLNFGHTLGHAIENITALPHGHAVSIGMVFAAQMSEIYTGFVQTDRVRNLLQQYKLPVSFAFDKVRALQLMAADKKKAGDTISYVLLREIGTAVLQPLSIADIRKYLIE